MVGLRKKGILDLEITEEEEVEKFRKARSTKKGKGD